MPQPLNSRFHEDFKRFLSKKIKLVELHLLNFFQIIFEIVVLRRPNNYIVQTAHVIDF